MTFIPTVACIRTAIRYKLFNEDVVNTLWWSMNSNEEPVYNDLLVLRQYLETWFDTTLSLFLSSDLTLADITCTPQLTLLDQSITISSTGIAGKLTGAASPSMNCITCTFRTAERGRSSRGRNYIGGIRVVDITANVVDSEVIDNIQFSYGQFGEEPPTGMTHVVVSHVTGGVNRAFGLKQPVIDWTCSDNYLDGQHRRGKGRGS